MLPYLCLSGAGEPKCKEAKASAAAEVPEFPAATTSEFPTAAKFPKLPATAELPAAAELWCAAAAKVFNPAVCTACRVCSPAGLWGKGGQMLDFGLGEPGTLA